MEAEAEVTKYQLQESEACVLVRQLPSMGLSFQVWPAASALCSFLETKYGPRGMLGLEVLELGSGTGLVGIVAAALGARVVLTDLEQAVSNLQHNAEANAECIRAAGGGSVRAQVLKWGVERDARFTGAEKLDLVLASDVVYYDYLFQPLLDTLKWLMNASPSTVVLLAHLRRWKKDSRFFKQARKAFVVEVLHKCAPEAGSSKGVTIYSMSSRLNPILKS